MPLPQHIVLKKKNKETQVWLAESYLIEATGVTYDYLMKNRHASKSWSFISISGTRYYQYFSIPDRAPSCYRSKLPTYEELTQSVSDAPKKDTDIYDYFESALSNVDAYITYYKDADIARRDALAKSASVVMHTVRYISDTSYNTKKFELFNDLAALVEQYKLSYLPYNSRRLKEKIMLAVSGLAITEIVYLPRTGNNNAAKFMDDDQLETWLYELQSNPKNFSDAHIIRTVKHLCEITDRPAPSAETIKLKLSSRQAKFITSLSRFGRGTRNAAEYEGTVPLASAPFAGDCWQIDATRVNLIAHERIITDAQGNKIKSLANIMVCAVRDVHSGAALGYSYDYAENSNMYLNALKMAVEQTGYLPYELITDRFPGHNTPIVLEFIETLKLLGVKITISHKATGKAQMERWFNTMQQIEMQGNDHYYGEGIRSTRKAAHVSPDWLDYIKKQAKKEGYDITDTINEYSAMIETHNSKNYSVYSKKYKKLHKSPADLHSESEKPNVIEVTNQQINHIFGRKTDVKVGANGLIKIEFRSVVNYFLIENYDIIEQNSTVCASYDPTDLSSVEIYQRIKNSTWLKHLCTALQWQTPNVYGPQAEFNRLAEMKKRQRDIDDIRNAKLAEKLQPVMVESNEEPSIFEHYNAEEEVLMGQYTMKKAAGGYEDIELNPANDIYNQLFNRKQ